MAERDRTIPSITTGVPDEVGKGAEHGVLIRNGEALQTASQLKTLVLDKTGTITKGKPELTDVVISDFGFRISDFGFVSASRELRSAISPSVVGRQCRQGIRASAGASHCGWRQSARGRVGRSYRF